MAKWIKHTGEIEHVDAPISLTDLQTKLGGFVKFLELLSGDVMVVNEAAPEFAPLNKTAVSLANRPIYGHVVLCEPGEIA